MTQDRVQRDSFILGHHFVSYMLAVPEATVTSAMAVLSKAHLLTYSGNLVHVLDRSRLKVASCSCYDIINREYERLLNTASR
jgi:hypothetical protein